MQQQQQQPQLTGAADAIAPQLKSPKRPARSKNGCMTCRRRKVRCNEIRPICGHCSRLNLECRWRPTTSMLMTNSSESYNSRFGTSSPNRPLGSPGSSRALLTPLIAANNSASSVQDSFDDVFSYASFMWDGPELWRSPPGWPQQDLGLMDSGIETSVVTPSFSSTMSPPINNGSGNLEVGLASSHSDSFSAAADENPALANLPAGERSLLGYFIQSVVPPIIAQVETQSRGEEGAGNTQQLYAQAAADLSGQDSTTPPSEVKGSAHSARSAMLATLFFLSYTDLLEGRMEATHASLERAYELYQASDKSTFKNVEIRILSWIRLIDARAVSAGGVGLFLSVNDERLLAHSSPGSFDGVDPSSEEQHETDIEEVLFDILYQPGIVFYQKVQSFMGRISHQDPWHRHRGTVEDETEVMSVASEISKDLRKLYDSRPPLMDFAAAGLLTAPHISTNLAFTITRAFRTFLSNYHACRLHLHRVAYKSLPLTKETIESMEMIRNLSRMLVNGPDGEEPLPVNMLWPLMMWGSEEKSIEERSWIRMQILRMEKVATNARITSQVLDEVQRRQDSLNARQDIREVMEHIFNTCFAIV